ncbi:MAG TPA: hypothetical protein VF765_16100 [Polyangiaceae bacterium]
MTKTPVRARARAIAILVPFLCVLGVGGACTEQLRTNGQACLKDGDCLSGVCTNSVCVAAAPLLDAEVNGDGSLDAGGEAASDAPPDGITPPMDAAKESAPPMEAATESGTDGSGMGEGGGDGSTD